jgi:hypothetical protein
MTITVGSLMALQSDSVGRQLQKQQALRHRRERSVALGPCMRLQFEDTLTVRYQIQEMLRAGRRHDADTVQHEIDTYAHLLPDGSNWKATLMIEMPDAHTRRRALPQLNEAAHRIYVEVARHARVVAEANEDQPDRHLARHSAVHFLRFELPQPLRAALLAGAGATLGCAHDQYAFRRVFPPLLIGHLRQDLVPAGAP